MPKAKAKAKPKSRKNIRVGFIGAGGIARHHMGILSKLDKVKVAAASDVSDAALESVGSEYKNIKCFGDYKEMLAEAKIDAVSVCTPNYLHAQPAIDALNAGYPVIVEKPMAMNAEECQAMIDASTKNDQLLVVGFQYRYDKESQAVKRYIDDGQFGDIIYGRCKALRRRGIPNWGVFTRKDLQGGGPMIDIGVHIIEVTHYLMGSPKPISVSGNTYTYIGDQKEKSLNMASSWSGWDYENYTVEDLAVGLVKFENGATLSIEASFAMHGADEHSAVIMGTKAGANLYPLKIFKDEAGAMVNVEPHFLPQTDGFTEKMKNWIHCIRTGDEPNAPAEHGLRVQQILDGVYRSAESGREVRYD